MCYDGYPLGERPSRHYPLTMRELTLAIVGIDFPNSDGTNRRSELMFSEVGEPIELRPEPKNKHDELAVAVYSARGVQVGYVTAERAPLIGSRLRDGVPVIAIYQGLVGSAGYARVRFDGEQPTLPIRPDPVGSPVRDTAADDCGFYPDPDGPEWGA